MVDNDDSSLTRSNPYMLSLFEKANMQVRRASGASTSRSPSQPDAGVRLGTAGWDADAGADACMPGGPRC